MNGISFVILLIALIPKYLDGKPITVSGKTDADAGTTLGPKTTSPPPWLRFLNNKKSTTTSAPPNTVESVTKSTAGKPKGPQANSKAINSIRAIQPVQPSQSEMDELVNWLGVYLQPMQSSTNVLAADRQQNPDSLYDEVYLDWMKRQVETATVSPQSYYNNEESNPAPMAPAQVAQPQQMPVQYSYPTVPLTYPYGYPFMPSLAGFKMNKVLAQAQVDAAMAALNITTTPKPMKLKLKIMVPGNIDMTQFGQITSGLASSLPMGSTYELA